MSEPLEGLTAREREVLALVAEGASNGSIADKLVISTNTVQTHMSHILGKLAVKSRWQAADIWNAKDH